MRNSQKVQPPSPGRTFSYIDLLLIFWDFLLYFKFSEQPGQIPPLDFHIQLIQGIFSPIEIGEQYLQTFNQHKPFPFRNCFSGNHELFSGSKVLRGNQFRWTVNPLAWCFWLFSAGALRVPAWTFQSTQTSSTITNLFLSGIALGNQKSFPRIKMCSIHSGEQ